MKRLIVSSLVLSLGILSQACGDDDDASNNGNGGSGGSGGSAGKGNTGGSAGSAQAGSGGSSAGAGGAQAGASGSGAGGGAAGSAGSSGSAGSAGSAGTPGKVWGELIVGEKISGTEDDRISGVAFDGDKIYATGYIGAKTEAGDDRRIIVAKYDSAGKLDKTWGVNGIFTLPNLSPYLGLPDDPATTTNEADASLEGGIDVVVQADHKVVVLARTETIGFTPMDRTAPTDLVLFRLTAAGALDKDFGDPAAVGDQDGLSIISFGSALSQGDGPARVTIPDDAPYSVDLDAQDRLYAFSSGLSLDPARVDADRYVVRLSKDGVVDTTFGALGKATFDVPQNSLATANPVTLKLNDNQRNGYVLPDGSVVSSGYTNVSGRNQVVIAKFTSEGKLDVTFSNDGIARLAPFAEGVAEAYGVTWQSNGSLVTTGYGTLSVEGPSNTDLVSFRVNKQGAFDTTWGVGGSVVFDQGGLEDRGRYVIALPDDRILMVGATTPIAKNKDAMVLLLDKDGNVADGFSASGDKHHDFGGNDEFFTGATSKDGKWIAVAGYAATSGDLPALKNGDSTFALLAVP